MGEIAEMMLDGTLCACCGEYLGEDAGFPVYCAGCDPSDEVVFLEKPRLSRAERRQAAKEEQAEVAAARAKAKRRGGWYEPMAGNSFKSWFCECGKRFETREAQHQHARAKGCKAIEYRQPLGDEIPF